ncbi:MAG: hypothetical protein KKB20_00140 [Proteobacteria bacterium]|nr:hypothetical protein [Pseudomonadota bacterium]
MRKKLMVLWFVLPVLLLCFGPALAADSKELVKQGDDWYSQRGDSAKAKMAVETYRQALAADPNNGEAAWKLARALYWVGESADKDMKLPIYEEAMKAAEQGTKLLPNDPAPHYWLAVVYGLYGTAKGIFKSLSLVKPIKEECQAVIKLDPGYNGGGAYMILGRLNQKVPGFGGGDKSQVEPNYMKALELGPDRYNTHNYLADWYMDEDQYDKAKAILEKAINGPCPKDMAPDCKRWKADSAKRMAELEKKMK